MKFVNVDNSSTMVRKGEPTMKITVKGFDITVQDGDDITVYTHPCDSCGDHTSVTVYRRLPDSTGRMVEKVVFEKEQ